MWKIAIRLKCTITNFFLLGTRSTQIGKYRNVKLPEGCAGLPKVPKPPLNAWGANNPPPISSVRQSVNDSER